MSTPAPAAVPAKVAPKKVAPKKKGFRPSVVKKAMKASKVPIMKCVIDCTLPLQDKIFDINAFVNTRTHTHIHHFSLIHFLIFFSFFPFNNCRRLSLPPRSR